MIDLRVDVLVKVRSPTTLSLLVARLSVAVEG